MQACRNESPLLTRRTCVQVVFELRRAAAVQSRELGNDRQLLLRQTTDAPDFEPLKKTCWRLRCCIAATIEEGQQGAGIVGDDTVDLQSDHSLHSINIVDGPGMNRQI